MKIPQIQLPLRLSAIAYRAYKNLAVADLELAIGNFVEATLDGYEDFADTPAYYVTPGGTLKMKPPKPVANARKVPARVSFTCFKMVRKLQSRGFGLSWVFEEALFYQRKRGQI